MSEEFRYDLGVDVGGTNTDIAILKRGISSGSVTIVGSQKQTTTPAVASGIVTAVEKALAAANLKPTDLKNVFIGTTQFVNAVVERAPSLAKVAVIRLGGVGCSGIKSFETLPRKLRDRVDGGAYIIDGGYDFQGRPYLPLDEKALDEAIAKMKAGGIRSVAVVGMFSTTCPTQEDEVAKKILQSLGGADKCDVTGSRHVGGQNLILREHAAILNSALKPLARTVVRGFRAAFRQLKLAQDALVFMTQNDGTVVTLGHAADFPIRLCASGPTNSMRGAYLLAKDALRELGLANVPELFVCDIGGTTSDIGVIECRTGFPRESTVENIIGGTRIQSRFPDTESLALGVGTEINLDTLAIGPQSVGAELLEKGYIFTKPSDPQRTLTATDVAVAAGHADDLLLGDKSQVAGGLLYPAQVAKCIDKFIKMLEISISRMKTKPQDVPLLLCGGGTLLLPKDVKIAGVSCVIVPPNSGVANAVGAAMAEVSADLDEVADLANYGTLPPIATTVDEAENPAYKAAFDHATQKLQEAMKHKVREKAIHMGALDHDTNLRVTEMNTNKLAYMNDFPTAIHVRARAVGMIDFSKIARIVCEMSEAEDHEDHRHRAEQSNNNHNDDTNDNNNNIAAASTQIPGGATQTQILDTDSVLHPQREASRPNVDSNGVWSLTEEDVELIALGAGVLGVGGGGNTYHGLFRVRCQLAQGRSIKVITPKMLPKDSQVFSVAFFGVPTIMTEAIGSSEEMFKAYEKLCSVLKSNADKDDSSSSSSPLFAAIFSIEAGGTNCLEPMVCAAQTGIPFLDADGMGRAFPRYQFVAYLHNEAKKQNPCFGPLILQGAKGEPTVNYPEKLDGADHVLRTQVVNNFGGIAAIATPPLHSSEVEEGLIKHSISFCYYIGRAIHNARVNRLKKSPVDALLELTNGRLLAVGTLTSKVMREGHFSAGHAVLSLDNGDEELCNKTVIGRAGFKQCEIHFVNDFLLVRTIENNNNDRNKVGEFIATTPDLISLVDRDTARPYYIDEVRHGLRVAVLQLPSPAQYRPGTAPYEFVKPSAMASDFGSMVDGVEGVMMEQPRVVPKSVCDVFRAALK